MKIIGVLLALFAGNVLSKIVAGLARNVMGRAGALAKIAG